MQSTQAERAHRQAKQEGAQGMQRLQGLRREARKKKRLSGLGSQDFCVKRQKNPGIDASLPSYCNLSEICDLDAYLLSYVTFRCFCPVWEVAKPFFLDLDLDFVDFL